MARTVDAADYFEASTPWVTSDGFTLSCWVKCSQGSADFYYPMAVGEAATSNNQAFLQFADVSGALVLRGFHTTGAGSIAATTNNWTAGTWHHACLIVPASSDFRVVLDGDFANSDTGVRGGTPANWDTSSIGRVNRTSDLNSSHDADVAWAAVYDVALSQHEVERLANYEHPIKVRPESLIHGYDLDESSSSDDAIDRIGGFSLSDLGTLPAVAGSVPVSRPWGPILIPDAAAGVSFSVTAEALSFTGVNQQIDVGQLVTVSAGSIAWTGVNQSILTGQLITVSAESVLLTGGTFGISTDGSVTFPVLAGSIDFATGITTILDGRLINVSAGAINFDGDSITIDNGQVVESSKGGQSMTLRQMRELEKAQLQALLRDDDELVAIIAAMKRRRLN